MNEAAERLLKWVPEDAETQANFRFRVQEALDEERRAMVKLIRASHVPLREVPDHGWVLVPPHLLDMEEER